MEPLVDLHLHTTASDGRWTPEELVRQVQRAGIGLFAVTDHDSLGALADTAALASGDGLCFVHGVELSTRLNGQLYHLLAYGIDPGNPGLLAFVEANNARLLAASDEAVHLLAGAGYRVALDQYDQYTWDRRRGGWKALNFLIDQGLCRDVRGYFDDLFGGELKHPEAMFPTPAEAIETAKRAGGVVVLAHPGAAFYNGLTDRRLDQLAEMGMEGLECFSFHHDARLTARFLDYCRTRDLLVTGGSDSHGGFANRCLGVPPVHLRDLRLGAIEDRLLPRGDWPLT